MTEPAQQDEPDTRQPEDAGPPPFLAALRDVLKPSALDRASRDMGEVVDAVRETGKKGRVQLTIDLVPDKHDPSLIVVKPKITAKVPEDDLPVSHRWPVAGGRLSAEDPRQPRIAGLEAVND